ncbi:ABC transporter substrate-binding protein [Acetobacteraceae bacterium ESL0709]|nr:ABC transporter substrate-binding protein [Acetobacteraceae bacterium ESL0697]MDF7678877.1 ABC transporter substrate-binding protein [Acetobacteraceae bacterium ESL0709]
MFRGFALNRRHFLKLAPIPVLAALSPLAHAENAQIIKDCRGRPVTLRPWQRIAVIGGTLTETLYALGASERIIGVDSTATWPKSALKEKPSFGYMRALAPEGILSLNPDLILAIDDAGPIATMDQLIASRIPVFFIEKTPSPEAVDRRTRLLAKLVQKTNEGEQLCREIDTSWNRLSQWRGAHTGTKKILFILHVANGRPVVAGRHTAAEQIIHLAGGKLVTEEIEGYKTLNSEAITTLQPDIILTMTENEQPTRQLIAHDPAFRLTPAGQKNLVIAMEGERLLGFGPRTADAALELAQILSRA